MINYQIYLAGGIEGLTFKEMNLWRLDIANDLLKYANKNNKYNLDIINPYNFYNFKSIEYKTQREVMEFDLNKVRTSQLIIVDFSNKPLSIGTAMELAIARENKIPIIGLYIGKNKLHPWLIEHCTRLCDTYDELVEHIKSFYLV